jgi:AcrR family transcriptional regulator
VTDAARARPGGRTARTRAAVLDAVLAELVEHGYRALTVEAVAARSEVHKATLYRRWGGRDGLVADAVETFAAEQARAPDTGDVDEDLRRWTRSILATLTEPASRAVVLAVFGGAHDSPELDDLRRRFWHARSALVVPVVERAVARGQLPAGTDPAEVVKHVGAPLYYRLLVLGEALDSRAADLAAAVTAAAAHAGVFAAGTRALG